MITAVVRLDQSNDEWGPIRVSAGKNKVWSSRQFQSPIDLKSLPSILNRGETFDDIYDIVILSTIDTEEMIEGSITSTGNIELENAISQSIRIPQTDYNHLGIASEPVTIQSVDHNVDESRTVYQRVTTETGDTFFQLADHSSIDLRYTQLPSNTPDIGQRNSGFVHNRDSHWNYMMQSVCYFRITDGENLAAYLRFQDNCSRASANRSLSRQIDSNQSLTSQPIFNSYSNASYSVKSSYCPNEYLVANDDVNFDNNNLHGEVGLELVTSRRLSEIPSATNRNSMVLLALTTPRSSTEAEGSPVLLSPGKSMGRGGPFDSMIDISNHTNNSRNSTENINPIDIYFPLQCILQRFLVPGGVYNELLVFGMENQEDSREAVVPASFTYEVEGNNGAETVSSNGSERINRGRSLSRLNENPQNGVASSETDCVVCLTNPLEIILYPCRHYCICLECAHTMISSNQSRACPICRVPVDALIQVGNS